MKQAAINSDLTWVCRTDSPASQYTWRLTLFVSVAISGIILAIQFPITIYSPDVSFHAAKISRASNGELFVDPFIVMPTIYPSLFHFCFGLLKRALNFDSIQIIQLIVLVDFIGLFAAFYYLAAPFFNSAEETSLCVLSLPLVFYAPTGRYLLLAEPSNFSFVFLILGIGGLYRYLMTPKCIYLISGGLLLSLAVNIWWSNIVSVAPILLLLTYYTITRGLIPKSSHILYFILAFLGPCLYTAWHFHNIWEILPNYLSEDSRDVNVLDIVTTWMTTFLTKGNLQFWDFSNAPWAGNSFLSYGVGLLHVLSLLLVVYVGRVLVRKDRGVVPDTSLARTLAMGSFFVLLFSIVLLENWAVAYWSSDVSSTHAVLDRFLVYGQKLLFLMPSLFHYFLLVLPFNLLLVVYVGWVLVRKDTAVVPDTSLARTLAMGGLFVLLFSMTILFYLDTGSFATGSVYRLYHVLTLCLQNHAAGARFKKAAKSICLSLHGVIVFAVLYRRVFSSSLHKQITGIRSWTRSFRQCDSKS